MTPIALDIAVGIIILMSTMAAYFRGIIKEVFTLAALGISVFIAYEAGHLLVPPFNDWLGVVEGKAPPKDVLVLGILSPPLAAKVFAYGGIFLLMFTIITLLGRLLNRWVNEAGLGIVDRLLGGGFGFLRGFLIMLMLYMPASYLLDYKKFPVWAKDSASVHVFQGTMDWANKTFELDKKIEDRGGGIAIKFDKFDIEKIKDSAAAAEAELKKDIQKEEKEIQKSPPSPEGVLDRVQGPPPAPIADPMKEVPTLP